MLASHVGIVAVQDASRVARTQSLSLERCGTFGMVGRVSAGWRRSSAGPRIESKLASRFEISFFHLLILQVVRLLSLCCFQPILIRFSSRLMNRCGDLLGLRKGQMGLAIGDKLVIYG